MSSLVSPFNVSDLAKCKDHQWVWIYVEGTPPCHVLRCQLCMAKILDVMESLPRNIDTLYPRVGTPKPVKTDPDPITDFDFKQFWKNQKLIDKEEEVL